jgi:hypothetical protein
MAACPQMHMNKRWHGHASSNETNTAVADNTNAIAIDQLQQKEAQFVPVQQAMQACIASRQPS